MNITKDNINVFLNDLQTSKKKKKKNKVAKINTCTSDWNDQYKYENVFNISSTQK